MKTLRQTAFAVAALALAGMTASGQRGGPLPARMPFEAGKPFPALVLPALETGEPASIAEYRGKKIILHIFASW